MRITYEEGEYILNILIDELQKTNDSGRKEKLIRIIKRIGEQLKSGRNDPNS